MRLRGREMTRRKTPGLIASLALTAALAAGVVWAACSSGSGGESAVGLLETPTPTATAVPTSETGTPATLTPTPSATPVPSRAPLPSPAPLPPPDAGYTWQEVAPNTEYGWPGYAVQVPEDWTAAGLGGNPVPFSPRETTDSSTQLTIMTMITPASAGYEHPILFNLPQMGITCGTGVPWGQMPGSAPDAPDVPPATQFAGDLYTWNVYFFSCWTRVSAAGAALGEKSVPFDVRAAEVQVGDFILSVTAFEPPGSAAAEDAFQKALQTFTLQ
jgi:hypothetical protein